jgi:hypothetical protein
VIKYKNGKLSMVEGDFGQPLIMNIVGGTITQEDVINFFVKNDAGDIILSKDFTNVVDNKVHFVLTKEESDKLQVGNYIYNLDWFRDGVFMNNIKNNEIFQVKDK